MHDPRFLLRRTARDSKVTEPTRLKREGFHRDLADHFGHFADLPLSKVVTTNVRRIYARHSRQEERVGPSVPLFCPTRSVLAFTLRADLLSTER